MLRLVAGLFAFMILGGSVSAGLSGPDSEWLRFMVGTASFHGATLLLVAAMLREADLSWAVAFGLRSGRPVRVIGIGAVTALMALPMAWALSWASAELMRALFIEPSPQQAVTSLQSSRGALQKWSMGFMAVVMAPMAEEVMFRGILYPILKQRIRPWFAVVTTAIVFGAIHGNLMTFVPLTVFAMVLVWLYEFTGNLAAPVLAHSVFNLANLVALFWAK
jgi:membrane protease YdiL (CAAX protease family)